MGLNRGRTQNMTASRAASPAEAFKFTNNLSQFADDRPVTCCAYTNDGQNLITASWSGNFKVWSLPFCDRQITINAHKERITGIATNPLPSTTPSSSPSIATSSADRTARLWTLNGDLLHTL